MLESNLQPGAQKIKPGEKPDPCISITDGCVGWEETEELIRMSYDRPGEIYGRDAFKTNTEE